MYSYSVGERIMLEKLLDDLTETPRKIANLENAIYLNYQFFRKFLISLKNFGY